MNSYLDGKVETVIGDITAEHVDAIVNAANSSLLGGGGVDGAIHCAGGPTILKACRVLRDTRYPSGLPTGEAVVTTAGKLNARFVIHTVGPIWHDGNQNEPVLLGRCYTNSLTIASACKCKTIALPAISTGIYGFPRTLAARIASDTIRQFLNGHDTEMYVRLVFFNAEDADIFAENQIFAS